MYMPQPQDEQHPRNDSSQKNDSKNSFLKLIYWLFQQAYNNKDAITDLIHFLLVMCSVSMMIRVVDAAKTDKTIDDEHVIEEYKEPYCEGRNDGTDFCVERHVKVFERGGIKFTDYAYNDRVNNVMYPRDFINHPRFGGRPAVYRENPNPNLPLRPNPYDPFADRGLQHGLHQDHFDPHNRNNFFAQGGRQPAIQHQQPLDQIQRANDRVRNNPRR